MSKLISCEYNMDTACVELKYSDGSLISIDTTPFTAPESSPVVHP